METLFGLQMQYIAAGLTATLLILILAIAIIAIRNRFLIKLSLRNIPRRRTQSISDYCRSDALIHDRCCISSDRRHDNQQYSQRCTRMASGTPISGSAKPIFGDLGRSYYFSRRGRRDRGQVSIPIRVLMASCRSTLK